MPRVSVVVPNYNHSRYLERRLDSILSQSYQDFELILLDDASTDGSVDILQQYARHPRARLEINRTNSGSAFAQWNRGVALARGELVWIAEADDAAEPELLESLVHAFDADPQVVIAYCQSWRIDESNHRIATKLAWTDGLDRDRWKSDYVNEGRDEVSRYLCVQNSIPNASAALFRRAAYVEAGGATEHLRLCGDWMTWVKVALLGRVAYIARPLNEFREHANTVRSATSEIRELHESLEVLKFIDQTVGVARDLRSDLALRVLNDWKARYWRQPDEITWHVFRKACAVLRRLDASVAAQFALFFALQRVLGKARLRTVRHAWTIAKRFGGRRT